MMTDVRPFYRRTNGTPIKKQIQTGNTGTSEPFKYRSIKRGVPHGAPFLLEMRLRVRRKTPA